MELFFRSMDRFLLLRPLWHSRSTAVHPGDYGHRVHRMAACGHIGRISQNLFFLPSLLLLIFCSGGEDRTSPPLFWIVRSRVQFYKLQYSLTLVHFNLEMIPLQRVLCHFWLKFQANIVCHNGLWYIYTRNLHILPVSEL